MYSKFSILSIGLIVGAVGAVAVIAAAKRIPEEFCCGGDSFMGDIGFGLLLIGFVFVLIAVATIIMCVTVSRIIEYLHHRRP